MDVKDSTSPALVLDEWRSNYQFYSDLSLLVFIVLGVICLSANFILAFVIIRYKRLRSDPTNITFLHIIILETIYMFFAPVTMRIFTDIELHKSTIGNITCLINDIDIAVLLGIAWFAHIQLTVWFVKVHTPCNSLRFQRFYKSYKSLVIFNYFLILVMLYVSLVCCVGYDIALSSYYILTLSCAFITLFVTLIAFNIIHIIRSGMVTGKEYKDNKGLAIVNFLTFSWCPVLTIVVLSIFDTYLNPIWMIIGIAIGHSSPIFNLIYLYFNDNDYYVFLNRLVKCQCNEYNNDELIDDTASSDRYDEHNLELNKVQNLDRNFEQNLSRNHEQNLEMNVEKNHEQNGVESSVA